MKHKLFIVMLGFAALPQLAMAREAFNPPAAPAAAPADSAAAVASPYNFNLSYADAETAVANEISAKGDGAPVSAIIMGKRATPLYVYSKPITTEVRDLNVDATANRWSANLLVSSEGNVLSAMPLSGRFTAMVELPVLKHQIRQGDVISEADIETKLFAQDHSRSDTIADAASLVGKSPLHTISSGRQIRVSEIGTPKLIKKNAKIVMRYKASGMEITTTGLAQADGAKDEVIDVLNPTSKKIVRAVVVDSTTADVVTQSAQKISQLTGNPAPTQRE